MKIQADLTAAAINLKRLAAALVALLLPSIVSPRSLAVSNASEWAGRCIERIHQPLVQRPHTTALPKDAGEYFGNRLLQSGVIVRDDELDVMQAASLQAFQKPFPARPALPVGEPDRKHLATTFLVAPDRDEHRLARNDPVVRMRILPTRVISERR